MERYGDFLSRLFCGDPEPSALKVQVFPLDVCDVTKAKARV